MGAYKAAKRGVAAHRYERRDRRQDSADAYWLPPLGNSAAAARPQPGSVRGKG
ncbi:hypothetical protein [Nocardia colli]|uniref:hypothetical protein n=1 Tax=Nocardia colli TaxID=2545717 RepID=UPI00168CBC40|nr:hypothetical protein [Nocardia colli]